MGNLGFSDSSCVLGGLERETIDYLMTQPDLLTLLFIHVPLSFLTGLSYFQVDSRT